MGVASGLGWLRDPGVGAALGNGGESRRTGFKVGGTGVFPKRREGRVPYRRLKERSLIVPKWRPFGQVYAEMRAV